ncbi:hypothetical protein [Tenacibaculum sp. M341]|uniref:hypothetical protein n=1 Tax=Tenacibaculum sp. M341 TaxID=2530339 RepID=UPI0010502822|nr:hypothetical protein [Tenacibaculum sp. M341]TCI93805.1 hypothetical protein EYW44_05150 [Tenacibaculum sp. M341]
MKYKLSSTDIYGNNIPLEYKIRNFITDEGIKKQEFQTFMIDDEEDDWFDFKIAFINTNLIKVTDMFASNNRHRKKGIPEALILEVKKLYKDKKIISSSNKQQLIAGEWRKPDADKVWKRLIKKSFAKYNPYTDTYELL